MAIQKYLIHKVSDYKFALSVFCIGILYFFVRFIYPETIEFGYDQPRLAYTVLDFINNGSFQTSQNYSLPTSWGNLSWGPLLIYFNSVFLKITIHPIYVSQLMIVFNFLSVILVILLSNEFFSKKVSLIAAITLALHPWWIIFSKMIYQPTPVPTFILFSTYSLFKTIKHPKSLWIIPLIFSWSLLIQSYLITISFVLVSILVLTYSTHLKLNYRGFFMGAIISIVTFIPSLLYYLNNPEMFTKFLGFKEQFTTTIKETLLGFINTLSGNNLKWQLGYGYQTFKEKYLYYDFQTLLNLIIFSFLTTTGIYYSVKNREKFSIFIVLLLTIPMIWIPFIGVEYVVPRYFLYVLPFLGIIFGIAIDNLIKKYSKTTLILPLAIFLSWAIFISNYFNFIKTYNYPNGFLSNWSDVPYSYLENSFNWIDKSARINKYDSYSLSSDLGFPNEFRFTWSQRYYWEHVLKRNENLYGRIGHYVMYLSPEISDQNLVNQKHFGPYVVAEFLTN